MCIAKDEALIVFWLKCVVWRGIEAKGEFLTESSDELRGDVIDEAE